MNNHAEFEYFCEAKKISKWRKINSGFGTTRD